MKTRPASRELVVVSDVHIGRSDPQLEDFCDFLTALEPSCSTLILLGDIFSLWLGRKKFTLAHHRRVLDTCRRLRAAGLKVVFVEGNREFWAGEWLDDAFDVVGPEFEVTDGEGRHWYFAHGDLLNREDWKTRVFHRLVRSRPVRAAMSLLSAERGIRFADRWEHSLRHRSLGYKSTLPDRLFEQYARWLAARDCDAGAIGHIHVEMLRRPLAPEGGEQRIYVLPDWKSGRRYLRIPASGEPRFESWRDAAAPPPAVVHVEVCGPHLSVRLESEALVTPGDPIEIWSGHSEVGRTGRVHQVDDTDPKCLILALDPGPPIQVGDRLCISC